MLRMENWNKFDTIKYHVYKKLCAKSQAIEMTVACMAEILKGAWLLSDYSSQAGFQWWLYLVIVLRDTVDVSHVACCRAESQLAWLMWPKSFQKPHNHSGRMLFRTQHLIYILYFHRHLGWNHTYLLHKAGSPYLLANTFLRQVFKNFQKPHTW